MMKYTVYQINLSDEDYNLVNRVGHEEAAAQSPAYNVQLQVGFRGSKNWKPEYFRQYAKVCTIRAENLEQVFEIGNIGPEESITRIAPMHSISVGDIVECALGYFMVDSFGFKEIEVDSEEDAKMALIGQQIMAQAAAKVTR